MPEEKVIPVGYSSSHTHTLPYIFFYVIRSFKMEAILERERETELEVHNGHRKLPGMEIKSVPHLEEWTRMVYHLYRTLSALVDNVSDRYTEQQQQQ